MHERSKEEKKRSSVNPPERGVGCWGAMENCQASTCSSGQMKAPASLQGSHGERKAVLDDGGTSVARALLEALGSQKSNAGVRPTSRRRPCCLVPFRRIALDSWWLRRP